MSNTQTAIELNKFIKKFNSDLKNFLPKSSNTLNKSISVHITPMNGSCLLSLRTCSYFYIISS